MMTQERIVATILFITFLVIAYRFYKMLMKKAVTQSQTGCSSGACGTCSFNSANSCDDKSYVRKEVVKVDRLSL